MRASEHGGAGPVPAAHRRVAPLRVLGFGTYDADRHPRVRVLLEGLRAHGARVAECNVPLGLSTAERVALLREPWRLPALAGRLLRSWARLAIDAARVRGDRRPDVVLVGYLGHFDVLLARTLFPRTTVVLDHLVFAADTARDRGVEDGLRQWLLRGLDRIALRCADVVVVDTLEHAAMVPSALRPRVVVVPVGADSSWFAAGRVAGRAREGTAGGHDGLGVIFFGLMTPLQGAPVVAAALRELDGTIRATMVGAGQDSGAVEAALVGADGVVRHRWVPPDRLPELVASHDVCLGIFGTSAKARHVVPTKVYQGAAAGCVVVTSDTAPQRRALGAGALLVPPGDPGALAVALRALAADPQHLADLRRAATERALARFTPEAVTAELAVRLMAAR
jgi:glycosyltransferase involved in cell wall biosynthesis